MILDLNAFRSAIVSTVLWAFIAVAGYVISLGDIFVVEWKVLVNIGALSLLTGLVSVIKNYLTNENGKVVGMKIK